MGGVITFKNPQNDWPSHFILPNPPRQVLLSLPLPHSLGRSVPRLHSPVQVLPLLSLTHSLPSFASTHPLPSAGPSLTFTHPPTPFRPLTHSSVQTLSFSNFHSPTPFRPLHPLTHSPVQVLL